MVQDTSKKTYYELMNEGVISGMQSEVLGALEHLGEATDSEIAVHLGYEDMNKVRPRRKELEELGIVVEIRKEACSITGRTAIKWGVNKGGVERKKNEGEFLTEKELNKVFSFLNRMNLFQKNKVKEWLQNQEEKKNEKNKI